MSYKVVKYVQSEGQSGREEVASFDERWEADEFAKSQSILRKSQGLEGLRYEVEETAKPKLLVVSPLRKTTSEPHKTLRQKPKKKRLTPAQQKRFVMLAGKCLACGNADITILEVHHIKPFAKRGSNRPWNLSVLCPTCHRKAQNGKLIPPALASKPSGRANSRAAVNVALEPSGIALAQLGDRVYNLIIQEVSNWPDPYSATCSEWDRLQLAERRLSLRVPETISSLLNQANELFPKRQQARFTLHEYIDETTKSDLISSQLVRPEDLGTVEFRVIGYPGVIERVNVAWIWEYETDLSNYLWDFVESKYPQNTKWHLETWVYPPKGGVRVRVGGDSETKDTINHVLRFLMNKPFARELKEYNRQIRELGKTITSLIDEELKKG